MADEVLRRAARMINDLRRLAETLNDAGYPGSAIRLQGFAGLLRGIEGELLQAQFKLDARLLPDDADALASSRFDDDPSTPRKRSGRLSVSSSGR
jgi:hypothetical protein